MEGHAVTAEFPGRAFSRKALGHSCPLQVCSGHAYTHKPKTASALDAFYDVLRRFTLGISDIMT